MWFATAPSNIALIKYMGKKDSTINRPDNPSLSYTLPNLLSYVQLEESNDRQDYWEALTIPGVSAFTLGNHAQQRFLNHLQRIKNFFNYQGSFVVRSTNNFPHSSGLASSASSFAALTKCAVAAINEIQQQSTTPIGQQAELSRQGSGSSCRSFYAPWALWDDERVSAIDLPYSELIHQVIIISQAEKEVSSSAAHQNIKSSPFYLERAGRASSNLKQLLAALKNQYWHEAYLICWREFQDMHQLFHSAKPNFTYFTPLTEQVLSQLQDFWQQEKDGPIVTMDAGPNIHLLYRGDQAELAQRFKNTYLVGNFDVL